jgi:hypothetical protein
MCQNRHAQWVGDFMDFENIQQCVVKILGHKRILLGTGFWVFPDGYCLTCFHIITDRKKILENLWIEYRGETVQAIYEKSLSSPGNDIAVLKAQANIFGPDSIVPLGLARMNSDVQLFGFREGFPNGFSVTGKLRPGQTLTVGKVYNLETGLPDGSSIEGMSGAPVFDPVQKLAIGILYGEEEKGPAISYVHPIDKAFQSWPALADRVKYGYEQTLVKKYSDKNVALLDRRLATEMVIFFSRPDRSVILDNRTPYLLMFALGLFDQLVVEDVYDGMLEKIIDREKTILDQTVTFVAPPIGYENTDFKNLMEENGKILSEDREFRSIVTQYERLKGSISGNVNENVSYLQHTLQLSKWINAVIFPHPDRWPLYQWWFEHCYWNTGSDKSNEIVKQLQQEVTDMLLEIPKLRAERVRKFSSRLSGYTKMPFAKYRYGPMVYPFLTDLPYEYVRERLVGFEPFLYEFFAPVSLSTIIEKTDK